LTVSRDYDHLTKNNDKETRFTSLFRTALVSQHQNDQLWIFMVPGGTAHHPTTCRYCLKSTDWHASRTALQKQHTERQQINSGWLKIRCRMPSQPQPSQVSQAWVRHQSILVICPS